MLLKLYGSMSRALSYLIPVTHSKPWHSQNSLFKLIPGYSAVSSYVQAY